MDRARSLEREAQAYVKENNNQSKGRALHLTPTLEEIRSCTFSEYVRSQIIARADADDSDDSEEEEEETSTKPDHISSSSSQHQQQQQQQQQDEEIEWNRGIAKVTLPTGFWDEEGIAKDRTGRGPQWQQGTPLGDLSVKQPIQQVLDGIGGIYEYTLLERNPMPLWKFREEADAFCKKQLGRRAKIQSDDDSDEYWDDLAKRFWKRLGPTMAHPLYGADMEGSLFGTDELASGWSLEKLDNCLKLLDASDDTKMPGVTTPYLYVGMFASVFCAHTEDMDLCSINYLHAGSAPKYWYAIAPCHAKRFESYCHSRFLHSHRACPDYLRHKQSLISPVLLKKAGIPFETAIQRPGDAILTYPGAYHFGVNLGFNIAEAVNFGVPEWIPLGRKATVCMCRPSSVRLDMEKFETLLKKYEQDVENAKLLGFPSLSYKQWAKVEWNRRANAKEKKEEEEKKRRAAAAAVPKVVHVTAAPNATTSSTPKFHIVTTTPAVPIPSSCCSSTTSTTIPTAIPSNNNVVVVSGNHHGNGVPLPSNNNAPTVSFMYDKNGKARMDKVWVTTELVLNDDDDDDDDDEGRPRQHQHNQNRKEDFWIEVMLPIVETGNGNTATNNNNNSNGNKSTSKKRQRKKTTTTTTTEEEWRLAKPFVSLAQRKKKLIVGTRVLVLLPSDGMVVGGMSSTSNSNQQQTEVCFAGQIVKVSEDHALIHFAGLSKREDVWMAVTSPKIFLDGGKWQEPTTLATTTSTAATVVVEPSTNKNKKRSKKQQQTTPKKQQKKKDQQQQSTTTTSIALVVDQQQPEKVASA